MLGAVETGGWVAAAASIVVAGISGWFLRSKAMAERRPADSQAAFDGYGRLVADLRADIDRQRHDLEELRVELIDCHRGHAECVRRAEEQEVELAELRGKVTALEARINRPPDARTRRDDR